jgi:tetratricopeptide (TPR) repeat protein
MGNSGRLGFVSAVTSAEFESPGVLGRISRTLPGKSLKHSEKYSMTLARAAARCLLVMLALAASPIASAQNPDLQQLNELVQRGELGKASQEVDAYVKAHPKDPRGRFMKGVVLARQNKVDEAIAVYNGLIADYPELPEPYNNIAALYASKGEYEAARDALERAVRAQPSYATAHENLGDVYARLAAQSYAKALELDPRRSGTPQKLKLANELAPPAPTPQSR